MTLLVNILFIVSSYLPNSGTSIFNSKYINQDYFSIKIMLNSPAEITTDNNTSTSNQNKEQDKKSNFSIFYYNTNIESFNENKYKNFLYRLLPILIDEPPPSSTT